MSLNAERLLMYRGDTLRFYVFITDSNGAVVNVSSGSLVMTAKNEITDGSNLFQVPATVADGPAGKFLVSVPASATAGLTYTDALPKKLYYDLEYSDGTNVQTFPPISGRLWVYPDVKV